MSVTFPSLPAAYEIETVFSLCFSPGGIPARNDKGERLLLFVGIIDILQSYRLKKKLEHTFKSLIHDGVSEDDRLRVGERPWQLGQMGIDLAGWFKRRTWLASDEFAALVV